MEGRKKRDTRIEFITSVVIEIKIFQSQLMNTKHRNPLKPNLRSKNEIHITINNKKKLVDM